MIGGAPPATCHHIATSAVVRGIAALLAHGDVRAFAAYALRDIGPAAKAALPALRAALKVEAYGKWDSVIAPSTDGMEPVCQALSSVAGHAPRLCKYHLG